MSPVSLTYWIIPGYILFWGIFALAIGLFLARIFRLVSYLRLGEKESGFGQTGRRLLLTIAAVLGQWCQLKNLTRRNRAGLGHAFMAWGFFIFFVFYFLFIVIGAGFGVSETLEHTRFFLYYAWVMDIAAVFVMLGAGWGIIRRYVIRPPRLEGERTFEAMIILVSVLIHPLTHLFKEATSIALGHPPAGLGITPPPISTALSNIFTGGTTSGVEAANIGFFWTHWLIVLFVLVFIAYSRYLHVVASIFNIFLQALPPKGVLKPLDFETAKNFGVSRIIDFSWKQLLDLYACVICGQCQDECPATVSGKALNPKKLVQDLKSNLLAVGPELVKAAKDQEITADNPVTTLASEVINEDEIWACTTCRACDEICPVAVEHVDKVVDLRRGLVMEKSHLPASAQEALVSLGTRAHPWRGTTATRTDWAEGLEVTTLAGNSDIDMLYWVGCTAALEERNMKVSAATTKILQAAGINFGILGTEESCCGDPARRLGDEYLFQTLAEKNIEIIKGYNVKKILTSCPHCFNVIKNEYPQFGGDFEVIHSSQLLAGLITEGRLKPGKLDGKQVVAYHDSCYLGRYNNVYNEPREVLKTINGIKKVELSRAKKRSFCCGGGGGHMWMEEKPEQRVNERRIDEVIQANVNIIATACPYCLSMFEDGLKAKEATGSIKAIDLSELLVETL